MPEYVQSFFKKNAFHSFLTEPAGNLRPLTVRENKGSPIRKRTFYQAVKK
jgi:hypothetical protein